MKTSERGFKKRRGAIRLKIEASESSFQFSIEGSISNGRCSLIHPFWGSRLKWKILVTGRESVDWISHLKRGAFLRDGRMERQMEKGDPMCTSSDGFSFDPFSSRLSLLFVLIPFGSPTETRKQTKQVDSNLVVHPICIWESGDELILYWIEYSWANYMSSLHFLLIWIGVTASRKAFGMFLFLFVQVEARRQRIDACRTCYIK